MFHKSKDLNVHQRKKYSSPQQQRIMKGNIEVKMFLYLLKVIFNNELNKGDWNRKILIYLLRFKSSRNKSKWKIRLD